MREFRLPAPSGINTISPGTGYAAGDAIFMFNLISSEFGTRARNGYREHVTNMTGAADNQVRAILPFMGSTAGAHKLFATTSSGIWDVTSSDSTPTIDTAFGDTSGNAGYGVSHVVVTAAGHFLVYADEVNGLFRYPQGGPWAAVTDITGVSETNLVHVTAHKNRLWMVERDSTRAWYLSAGAISGAATSFDFATKFKAGGHLVGLWSWTYDGGSGLDDSLVAISSGGDVVIYQGTDPAAASTWALKGVWSLGAVPTGRRIATENGGELLMASLTGALPASKLVIGGAAYSSQYATAKIGNLFSSLASTRSTLLGWSLIQHPGDNALLVTVPTVSGDETEQLAMSFATQGWSRYRDLPIFSAAPWQNDLYFGTADGRVCRAVDYNDAVLLSDGSSTPVSWSFMSGYTHLGTAAYKQLRNARPILLAQQSNPVLEATAKYDWDLIEASPPSGSGSGSGAVWDSAVWDTALWGGDYTPATPFLGLTGGGRDVAIALRGKSVGLTTLVGVDVFFEVGGLL
jgi:hypothetical protein